MSHEDQARSKGIRINRQSPPPFMVPPPKILQYFSSQEIWWAMSNGCVITHGTVGFGRECVGVHSTSNHWVDYEIYDEDNAFVGGYRGWKPEDAYHKHPCVAVLVHGDLDRACTQLALWIRHFAEGGYVVREMARAYENPLSLLFHGPTKFVVVKETS